MNLLRFRLLLGLAATVSIAGCKKGTSGTPFIVAGPNPAVVPSNVDFGALPVGVTGYTNVFVSNAGVGSFAVTALVDGGDFGLSGSLGVSLSGAAQETVTVSFTPSVAGARSGQVNLVTDVPNGDAGFVTVAVAASGVGIPADQVQLTVTPLALNFGQVQALHRTSQTFQVSNPNRYPVVAQVQAPKGQNAADFGLPATVFNLGPSQSATVEVDFVPAGIEQAVAQLEVVACPSCQPAAVSLSGSGIDGTLSFSPDSLDFGFVFNHPSPLPLRHVVANYSGDVMITVTHLEPSPNSAFQLANRSTATPLILTPPDAGGAQQFSFDVTYDPSGVTGGDFDQIVASYTLPTGDLRSAILPVVGNLSASPCRVEVHPNGALDFGAVAPGQQSQLTVELDNTGAQACLASGLQFAAPADPSFALGPQTADGGKDLDPGDGGATPFMIAAHGSLQLTLRFTAPLDSTTPVHQALLMVASGNPALAGVGVPLQAEVSSPYSTLSPWPKIHHDNTNSSIAALNQPGFDGGLLFRFDLSSVASASSPGCTAAVGQYQSNALILGTHHDVYQLGCDGVFHSFDRSSGASNWAIPLPTPPLAGQLITPVVADNGAVFLAYESAPDPANDAGVHPAADDLFELSTEPPSVQAAGHGPATLGASGADPKVYGGPTLNTAGQQLYNFSGLNLGSGGGGVGTVNTKLDLMTLEKKIAEVGFTPFNQSPPVVSLLSTGPAVDGLNNSYWCGLGVCVKTDPKLKVLWSNGGLVPGASGHGVTSPVLSGGQLLVYTFARLPNSTGYIQYNGTINALDPATGTIRWQWSAPPSLAPSGPRAALDPYNTLPLLPLAGALTPDGALVVPFVDGLYCVETAGPLQGQTRWFFAVNGGVLGTPAVSADGTVYSGSLSQGLVAVDAVTGHARGSFMPPALPAITDGGGVPVSISGSPVVGPEAIYFTADDGFVYAVH